MNCFRWSMFHGNYHGYYLKRPLNSDLRLSLLPPDIFRNKSVLDVGCNEGWLTCHIATLFHPSHVIGVDIDESLISAAWRRRRTVWSLQQPPSHNRKRKRRPEPSSPMTNNFFPSAFEHSLGPLPIPRATDTTAHSFPHNVSFRTADWVTTPIPEDTAGYNIVLALSVSKWIHLSAGDQGLRTFFSRVYSVLPTGGLFILEPQEWDSYLRAKRVDTKLKDNLHTLKLRPSDFQSILEEMGFVLDSSLSQVGQSGFQRPIHLYIKK